MGQQYFKEVKSTLKTIQELKSGRLNLLRVRVGNIKSFTEQARGTPLMNFSGHPACRVMKVHGRKWRCREGVRWNGGGSLGGGRSGGLWNYCRWNGGFGGKVKVEGVRV